MKQLAIVIRLAILLTVVGAGVVQGYIIGYLKTVEREVAQDAIKVQSSTVVPVTVKVKRADAHLICFGEQTKTALEGHPKRRFHTRGMVGAESQNLKTVHDAEQNKTSTDNAREGNKL